MTRRLQPGWSEGCLSDVVTKVIAGTSANCEDREFREGDRRVLKLSAVSSGRFIPSESKVVARSEHSRLRTPVRTGTVLFTRKNTPELVGDSAYISHDVGELYLPDLIWELNTARGIEPRWLNHWLQAHSFRRQIPSLSAGSSQSMVGISQGNLLASPVLIPPQREQKRIVAVLDAWDQGIDQIERLISAKQQRFSSVRINLIEAFQVSAQGNNSWRPTEFGEIAEELKQRNAAGHGPDRVMGVIKGEGLVPMRAHVMASDLRRYLVVPPRAIAYNPMRLNIGSIAASRYDEDVLVSPDYVVFRARKGRADPDFLRFLIGTKRWRDHLITVGSGSVRTRIYFDGLAEMVLRVPDVREQKRIGQMLAAMEQDLKTTIEAASALRTQKRGLMQKLLTGEWRLGEKFE